MRKTKGTVAVMEFGVRITRARARTLAMAAATSSTTNKKRKAVSSDEAQASSFPRRRQRFPRNSAETLRNSVENVHCSRHSRCSSNGSSELVDESSTTRSVTDLHSESLPYESSTCLNCSKRRDINTPSPSSSFRQKSDEQVLMENSGSRNSNRSKEEKIASPLEAEIDEFFSRAEKEEERRFTEKYNYDLAKDVPLEGRYDWVQLKPGSKIED